MSDVEKTARRLKEDGVQYLFGFYVDINGVPKSKCVPIDSLENMMGGSELYTVGALEGMGELGPHEDECAGLPDLNRLVVLPWDTKFALIPSSLHLDGKRYSQDSRNLLLDVVEKAESMGFTANVGIEPEFYVVRETEKGWQPLVTNDKLNAPTCGYDIEATMLAEPFLGPMVRYMNDLGWGVYSFDHEGGDGQYEFNFRYADALTMSDRMTIFRLMAKHVARENGCIATFMPKPFQDDFGSASHINISIASTESGKNLFEAEDGSGGYSEIAMQFVAGVLEHARAISAVVCPTVNSYKRFTSKGFMDEMSWAPIFQAWGENNRTLMCRMPVNRHCLEVRTTDSSVNYYLGIGFVLAAGLDGIERKLKAPDPINVDTYKMNENDPAAHGCFPLPKTLDEALDAFEESEFAKKIFGEEFHATFLKYKRKESHEFGTVVTDWEIEKYLQRV